MKKSLLFSAALILYTALMTQAPQGISHQAVIRNAQGELVTGQTIGIRVSILQGSAEGTTMFVETHEPESNENGLITYVIGGGTNVSGNFEEIDWADGPYFLKTEADPAGGTSYTIEGIQQLFSVPYALYAASFSTRPPQIIALGATEITPHSAILNGIVNAEGFLTEVVFEWGETTEYGNTAIAIQSPVKGSAENEVSAVLEGLDAETIYNYRIRATNAVDISYSEPEIFQTEEGSGPCTIADLHSMGDGAVDCLLEDVYVTYASPNGFYLQKVTEGPAIFSFEGSGWLPDVSSTNMIDIHVYELYTFLGNRQITARAITAVKGTNFDIDFLIKDLTDNPILSHENQSEIVKITGAVVDQIDGTTIIATFGGFGDWVEIRLDDVSGLDVGYTFDIVGLVHADNGTHYLRSWADDHLSNISPPDK